MPSVRIRVYGPLNDFLPKPARNREVERFVHAPAAVKDVIEGLGPPHPEIALVLVNAASVHFGYRVAGGERIAVYPHFFALDISGASRVLPPPPPGEPRFVLDGHLGRLAAYLRALGMDSAYSRTAADDELARTSSAEGRVLLTRDVGLLKRSRVSHGHWVRNTDPERQLEEVATRFSLADFASPFTRCVTCNGLLESIDKALVESRLPPRTRAREERFTACRRCGQVFWAGSHHDRMARLIARVLAPERRGP